MNIPVRYHIVPVNDLREHEIAPSCWCNPTPDDEDHDVLIHHSIDGRESFETGERRPS